MMTSKNAVYYVVIISGDEAVQLKMRKAISAMLPQAVVESLQGEEAIRYICHSPNVPDLFLLDKNERIANGFDIVPMIRASELLAKVPVVELCDETADNLDEIPGTMVQAVMRKSLFTDSSSRLLESLREIWYGTAPGKPRPGLLNS